MVGFLFFARYVLINFKGEIIGKRGENKKAEKNKNVPPRYKSPLLNKWTQANFKALNYCAYCGAGGAVACSLPRTSAPSAPRSALNSFYVKTCRHPFGMAKNSRLLTQWELVIREKRLLEQNPCSRGQLRPLCDYWRSLGLRGYTPYKLELYLIDKINSALKICGLLVRVVRSVASLILLPPRKSSISRRQKKKPRNRLLVPFMLSTQKDFCQLSVTRVNKNFIP